LTRRSLSLLFVILFGKMPGKKKKEKKKKNCERGEGRKEREKMIAIATPTKLTFLTIAFIIPFWKQMGKGKRGEKKILRKIKGAGRKRDSTTTRMRRNLYIFY